MLGQNTVGELKKELEALNIKYAPCPNIIAGLQGELQMAKAAHAPCAAQINELKQHLQRLDKKLAAELEKEEQLKKNLKKTQEELEKDEQNLEEDKRLFATKVLARCCQASESRVLAYFNSSCADTVLWHVSCACTMFSSQTIDAILHLR